MRSAILSAAVGFMQLTPGHLPDKPGLLPDKRNGLNIFGDAIVRACINGIKKLSVFVAASVLAAGFSAGCAPMSRQTVPAPSAAARTVEVYVPVSTADGLAAEENEKAVIDYSNASDGYVMVKYKEQTSNMLMTLIDAPNGEQYVYIMPCGEYAVLPLTEGDGRYVVTVCEQINDTKFKITLKTYVDVTLTDPLSPFLRPSRYVNYNRDSEVVNEAVKLAASTGDLLGGISAVYHFVTTNIVYDATLAKSVESGYLPNLDEVLKTKKGICFDYAAVMTAMLRCIGVPTKMVFGYTGDFYHAWISVYSEQEGWLDNVIFFDGNNWILMDPTFASGENQSEAVAEYIGQGSNYSAKFHY